MHPPAITSRRRVLAALLGAAAVPLLGRQVVAAVTLPRLPQARWLELASTHTGEALAVMYRNASGLVDGAVLGLQHLLRDHRNGEQHAMDTLLYDQLADLARAAGAEPRFEIISGYRSPATNAALHEKSAGVAVKSMHLEGRAIDVRLRGVNCLRLSELALSMGRGGVGYYQRSDFVHIDTGRVRSWQG